MIMSESIPTINSIIRDFTRENKKEVVLYLLLSTVYPISQIVLPYYYGQALSQIQAGKLLAGSVYTIIGVWLLTQLMYGYLNYMDSYMIPRLQSFVRTRLIQRIIETYKHRYEDVEIGAMMTTLIKLPSVIRDIAHQLRVYLVPSVMIFIGAFFFFLFIHRQLAIIYTLGLAMFGVLIKLFLSTCADASSTLDSEHSTLNEQVSDTLGNLESVYTSNTSKSEIERLNGYQQSYDRKYTETIQCASKFKRLYYALSMFMFLSISGWVVRLKLDTTQTTSAIIVALNVTSHISDMGNEIRDFIFNIGTVQRAQQLIHTVQKIDGETFQFTDGDIHFDNVSLTYDTKPVFSHLQLQIPARKCVAIVGPVGSGKTSLTKMIRKMYPYEGVIRIGGTDISRVDTETLRSNIAHVTQHPRMFNRSLYENARYGTDASDADVDRLIDELGVRLVFEDRDFSTLAGKNGDRLSGGQRQIIFLIRCLLRDTPIVILDEPTASLDAHVKQQVIDIIRRLMHGKTVIMVTHDRELLKSADTILKCTKK